MDGALNFNLLFPLLILVVFYFFLIRPQARRQKSQQKFMEELKKGDQVVTSSGIIGKISAVEDNIITIAVDNKTSLKVVKTAISKEMTDSLYGQKK